MGRHYISKIEPLTDMVRVWHPRQCRYGDPFVWFAVLRWMTIGEAELTGVSRRITPKIWDAAMTAFEERGVQKLLVTRYPNGADGPCVKIWLDVPSPFIELFPRKDHGDQKLSTE